MKSEPDAVGAGSGDVVSWGSEDDVVGAGVTRVSVALGDTLGVIIDGALGTSVAPGGIAVDAELQAAASTMVTVASPSSRFTIATQCGVRTPAV